MAMEQDSAEMIAAGFLFEVLVHQVTLYFGGTQLSNPKYFLLHRCENQCPYCWAC